MGQTVTVGCKLPHGFKMELGSLGSYRTFTLKGKNQAVVIGGDGITEEVDKEFFDAWVKEYAELAAIKTGMIYAHTQLASVKAIGRERVDLKTGLEPLDPSRELPKGISKVVG